MSDNTPKLTEDQLALVRIQCEQAQVESPDDFFAFVCEELLDDLEYWREAALVQAENAAKWRTR